MKLVELKNDDLLEMNEAIKEIFGNVNLCIVEEGVQVAWLTRPLVMPECPDVALVGMSKTEEGKYVMLMNDEDGETYFTEAINI